MYKKNIQTDISILIASEADSGNESKIVVPF